MNKSSKTHATLDRQSRINKSKKIITILQRATDLGSSKVLDIGTGSGYIISEISKYCKEAHSVDLEDERKIKSRYRFAKVNDESLPYPNDSFDIVISNYVIEHIHNQKKHLDEAHRVLKKGGILYLGLPNKYYIIDDHYKLPLITWIPRPLSRLYLQLLKNRDWDIYPLSRKKLRSFAKNKFLIDDLTTDVMKHPTKYKLDSFRRFQPFLKNIPRFMISMIKPFVPSYILILKKY